MLLWPRWHVTGLSKALNVPYRLAHCWLNQSRKMPRTKYDKLVRILKERIVALNAYMDIAEARPELYVTKQDRFPGYGRPNGHVARSKGQALHSRTKTNQGVMLI